MRRIEQDLLRATVNGINNVVHSVGQSMDIFTIKRCYKRVIQRFKDAPSNFISLNFFGLDEQTQIVDLIVALSQKQLLLKDGGIQQDHGRLLQ